MKIRNVLLFVFSIFFFACNDTGETAGNKEDTALSQNPINNLAKDVEHVNTLSLNNGAKWQSDESTKTHVVKLITELDAFNTKSDTNETAYLQFANIMQNELNSLVSDCKMKGANHEALHLWLEPVLKDVSDLKKIQVAEEGKIVTEKLTNDVKKFNEYFN